MGTNAKDTKGPINGPVEFEEAIVLTGYGKYQILLLMACGGCLMAVIMETLSMSYILPAAQCDLNLTLFEKGMTSGAGFLGVVLSSHLWGFIGDTMGRRKLLLITAYISFIVSCLSSLSPNVWLFITLRFFTGFFISGASAVVYAYLGEFHDNKRRPRILSWAATFISIATIGLPAIAWIVLPMTWSFYIPILDINMRPWRLLIELYALPTLICSTALIYFKESPKFLWNKGKHEEALEILRTVYSVNTGNPKEMYPVTSLVESNEKPLFLKELEASTKEYSKIKRFVMLMWHQTIPIIKPPYLKYTIMTSLLQFGTFAPSSGFLMWLPEILNRFGTYAKNYPNSTLDLTTCEVYGAVSTFNKENIDTCNDLVNEEVFMILLLVGFIFGLDYILIGTLITYVGKKLLLVSMLAITGVAGIITHYLRGYILMMVGMIIFIGSGCCVSVINTVVVDLYPTQYRGMAMSLSLMIGRFGAFAGSHLCGYLLEMICPASFFIMAGGLIALVFVVFCLPLPLLVPLFKKPKSDEETS